MTTPDIYTVEARRRLADAYDAEGAAMSAISVREWKWRDLEVAVLSATLREHNWQPPVDPDEHEAWEVYRRYCTDGVDFEHRNERGVYDVALAALKRGRELERGA